MTLVDPAISGWKLVSSDMNACHSQLRIRRVVQQNPWDYIEFAELQKSSEQKARMSLGQNSVPKRLYEDHVESSVRGYQASCKQF